MTRITINWSRPSPMPIGSRRRGCAGKWGCLDVRRGRPSMVSREGRWSMPRVVVRNGVLVPLEPLPEGWGEGHELEIPRDATPVAPQETVEDEARWAAIEQAASEITVDDFEKMQAAFEESDRQAKDWVRRR